MSDERLKIAVFIDYDNIEIGVKTTLGGHFDINAILEGIKERGEVVTKIAYGDWTRAGDDSRALTQHAIRMVQRNLTPGGDKNGADINLALDALEMALTHNHINAYVIVGGDSDFITLVEKLKQYDKKVMILGGRQFTSMNLQKNCHEFIAYENLVQAPASRRSPDRFRTSGAVQSPGPGPGKPFQQAMPLVRRALEILSEREVSPQLGLLKSTLLQLDSTFSERDYGAGTFRDFVEKLAKSGLVVLKESGRSLLVQLKEQPKDDAVPPPSAPVEDERSEDEVPAPVAASDNGSTAGPSGQEETPSGPQAVQAQQGPPLDAVRAVQRALQATSLRWPMYVRNIKQMLKSSDPGFDERRFGFAGILDLLRACQREGVLRMERDRRGALRVFPGAALPKAAVQEAAYTERAADTMSAESFDAPEPVVDAEVVESEVVEERSEIVTAVVDADLEAVADVTAESAPVEARPRRRRAASPAAVTGARKAAAPRRRAAAGTARKRTAKPRE